LQDEGSLAVVGGCLAQLAAEQAEMIEKFIEVFILLQVEAN